MDDIYMKEKDLVGKHMVSINDGTRAGTVKDLVFDELQLTALVVKGDRGEGRLPSRPSPPWIGTLERRSN